MESGEGIESLLKGLHILAGEKFCGVESGEGIERERPEGHQPRPQNRRGIR